MPYIGRDLNRGNYLKLDDISSSFNSSTKTFNLTVGGSAFTPGSAFSILVSVGGVIQEPESAYQVNNSEITFANAPTAQDGFFCIALGVPLGIGVPGNGTVNGTQIAKPFNYDGFFYLNDASNRVGINSSIPTSALDVSGTIKASSFSGPIGNSSGISTFFDLRVTNNLTVEGTTTTLDTNLVGVDRVEVGANSNSIVGVAVTQSGTADLVRLFDGAKQVVTIDDEGKIGICTSNMTAHANADDLIVGSSTGSHAGITIRTGGTGETNIFFADSDSGLGSYQGIIQYAHATNQFNFFTNGTQRVRIHNGGGVQLISSTPTSTNIGWTVYGGDTTTSYSTLNTHFPTTNRMMLMAGHPTNESSFVVWNKGDANTAKAFGINNAGIFKYVHGASELVRFQPDGKVGIGTNSPLGVMHIEGGSEGNLIQLTNDQTGATSSDGFVIGINAAEAYFYHRETKHIKFGTANGERLRITSDGKLGLGVVTPQAVMHIEGGSEGNLLQLSNTNTGSSIGDGFVIGINSLLTYFYNRENKDITFGTNNAERVRITNNGRVGINQTAPEALLHVENDNAHSSTYYLNSDAAILVDNKNNSGKAVIKLEHDAALVYGSGSASFIIADRENERLRIDSSGRVLIGTTTEGASSADTLTIAESGNSGITIRSGTSNGGHIYFSDGTSGAAEYMGLIHYDHSSNYMAFWTNGSAERLRIASNGLITATQPNSAIGLIVKNSAHDSQLQILATASNKNSVIFFGDAADDDIGQIDYDHNNNSLAFTVNTSEALRITSGGNIGIGTATIRNNRTVQISGESQSNLLITGNAPSICLNADADDSTDNDRTFLGQAIGSNNFANGTVANDTVLRGNSSGRIVFGIGTNVKMHLTSAGDLNIGSVGRFDANGLVKSAHGTESAPSHTFLNDPDNGMYRPTTNTLGFVTGGTERLRIDTDGKLLHGVTSGVPVCSVANARMQVHNNASVLTASFTGYGAHSGGSIIALGKSRSNTIGDATGAVSNGDTLGDIRFGGSDGTDMHNTAAQILGVVDGSVSSNTLPGRLVFQTNSGSGNTERLRIDSAGQVLPGADAVQDLGISTKRWRNVYTTDLQLSNVGGGGNEVDGTEGSWTLQEGESDIYMINRKTGKKYKMMLQEVS